MTETPDHPYADAPDPRAEGEPDFLPPNDEAEAWSLGYEPSTLYRVILPFHLEGAYHCAPAFDFRTHADAVRFAGSLLAGGARLASVQVEPHYGEKEPLPWNRVAPRLVVQRVTVPLDRRTLVTPGAEE